MKSSDRKLLRQGHRELDHLVAEKVMGLKTKFEKGKPVAWNSKTKKPVLFSPDDYIVLDGNGKPKTVMYLHGGPGYELVPNYSTDISAAWEVWEKLRSSGKWCCLDIKSDYHYCWTVTLIPSEVDSRQRKRFKVNGHKPAVIVDGEESAPRAICLAALNSIRP